MGCNSTKHPLLLERAGVTTARMQEVEQRMEQLPRRLKSSSYIPPHPNLLGNCSCVALLTYIHVGIPLEKEQ